MVANSTAKRIKTRIGDRASNHLFDVEVMLETGKREIIEVDENTRAQARSVAEKAGYLVASVNLVG